MLGQQRTTNRLDFYTGHTSHTYNILVMIILMSSWLVININGSAPVVLVTNHFIGGGSNPATTIFIFTVIHTDGHTSHTDGHGLVTHYSLLHTHRSRTRHWLDTDQTRTRHGPDTDGLSLGTAGHGIFTGPYQLSGRINNCTNINLAELLSEAQTILTELYIEQALRHTMRRARAQYTARTYSPLSKMYI